MYHCNINNIHKNGCDAYFLFAFVLIFSLVKVKSIFFVPEINALTTDKFRNALD